MRWTGATLGGGILLAIAVPASAAPGDMTLATFLAKADALKKRGALALLSSDFSLLKSEVEASNQAYIARLQADRAANRAPHSCPPQRAGMSSDELLAHFERYPAADRSRTTVRQGFFDLMKRRFPCAA